MARKKRIEIFSYECSITGETFKTTKKTEHADELISIKAYYELNPEKDDRPDRIKRETAE